MKIVAAVFGALGSSLSTQLRSDGEANRPRLSDHEARDRFTLKENGIGF